MSIVLGNWSKIFVIYYRFYNCNSDGTNHFPIQSQLVLVVCWRSQLILFHNDPIKSPQRIDVVRTTSAPRPHKKIINDKKSFQLKNMQTWRLIYHFYCAVAWARAYEGVLTYTATPTPAAYNLFNIYLYHWMSVAALLVVAAGFVVVVVIGVTSLDWLLLDTKPVYVRYQCCMCW